MKKIGINIDKISVNYGTNKAVRQVSMEIPINKVTAFIGPSGCGKTTLLRTLNRMNDEIEGCKVEGRLMMADTNLLSTRLISCSSQKSRYGFSNRIPSQLLFLRMSLLDQEFTELKLIN